MFEIQNRPFRSAKSWHELADSIDMYPEYQRQGGIWSDADQSLLIDSIINGYDMPKLYVVDFTIFPSALNTERKRFAVVDGKQRLEAIFRFFDGDLKLQKGTRWIDDPSIDIVGLNFDRLQDKFPELATRISEYPLPVMHIVTDEEDRIKDLFVRLNRGANLTGAEKRNAMIGPVPREIRNISKHKFFENYVKYPSKRGQNLNAAAKLLRFEISGKAVDTKKRQLDDMVLGYSKYDGNELRSAVDRVNIGLDRMASVFSPGDSLLSGQGNIPVYYLFLNAIDTPGRGVRIFLAEFEKTLRSTRKDQADRPTDLVGYDNAMRSTNDGWSYEARVSALVRRYKLWPAPLKAI